MPHPLTARRLLALAATQFTRQVPGLFAAAPLAFVLFALSLPGALLLGQLDGRLDGWFMLAGAINLLALARLALAWQRRLARASDIKPAAALGRIDGAYVRVLALLVLACCAIAALKAVSLTLGLALYFKLPGVSSTVFLAIALLAWLALWLPVMYWLGAWSLSLPRAALTDRYGLARSRQALRGRVWPFAGLLLLLTGITEVTGVALRKSVLLRWPQAIATAGGGLVITLVLVLFFAILCGTAYRERAEA
ncbi:hypothetical protein [Achromobacter xylosoxidans]|uniref:hypothetical protein n=1 Tax=Alcaligenes xylosoxydans xylosoxydans TaxID=85698 RepID=UPI00033228A0|nr:hypothetical protein [Achromobacter xylosoxidans]KMJ91620.1 hypothetical protein ACH58_02595 [Achromobacter xylosoxidans]MCZ8386678.1 hypothetical protein [Achromobacter xylosoxidans]NYS12086.1 hypothetical protein [Achromobacter xylosoxidans]CCH09111.1 hypothetical protein NH44784_051681 [Achromobacter xylosoxidans NH44784-1996]CUI49303.1 Uncharacterised protein [Achromobacter xylosoxidans]